MVILRIGMISQMEWAKLVQFHRINWKRGH